MISYGSPPSVLARTVSCVYGVGLTRFDGTIGYGITREVIQHQPNRPVTNVLRIPACPCHRSILSRNGASRIPGAVHSRFWGQVQTAGVDSRSPSSARIEGCDHPCSTNLLSPGASVEFYPVGIWLGDRFGLLGTFLEPPSPLERLELLPLVAGIYRHGRRNTCGSTWDVLAAIRMAEGGSSVR